MATTVRRVLATVVVVVVVLMVRSWRRFIPFGQIHLAVAVVSGRVLSLIVRLIVFLYDGRALLTVLLLVVILLLLR
uniref:Putative secreted peptide n=1 Tax=Anopheles braziliensis TaxID=58242 RepID=A0A2M3ZQS3_9DIPT